MISRDSLLIFTDSTREKLSEPEGCKELVFKQNECKKQSGDVTKFVW